MKPTITRRQYEWGVEVEVRLRRSGQPDLLTTLDSHGKLTVAPSYAVNPPYLQYLGAPRLELIYGGGFRRIDDRLTLWGRELRYAWTAHGRYATEAELQAMVDTLPEALVELDPETVLAALGQ